MDVGNYRLILEPENPDDKRNRHGWIVVQLLLLFPAAVMLALLLVALLRGA